MYLKVVYNPSSIKYFEKHQISSGTEKSILLLRKGYIL
jgi:hypothetical protein